MPKHRGVERKPDERQREKQQREDAETRVRQFAEKENEGEAFNRPAQGNPLALELDRQNQTDEGEECRALGGEARVARFGCSLLFSNEIQNSKRRQEREPKW